MVDVPTIRYVRNGDVALAYQVLGDRPIDLVFLPSFLNNLEIKAILGTCVCTPCPEDIGPIQLW